VIRSWLIPIIAAVLITTCTRSRADDKPQFDCVVIRAYVAEHGKAVALGWAIRNGYSLRQIREARKCLKE
jgi:hypothetical protein